MNVELSKNFPLDHNGDHAWSILSDIEAVASCMPGAEITEVVDPEHFKGKVKIKLGPVNMEFNGDITVQSIDADKQQIHLIAEGKDKKGTSSVSMDLTANSEAGTETSSALLGDAKVIVNGKLASFGQRMMAQVSDQILDQFADNFRKKLAATATASSSVSGETTEAYAVDGDTVAADAATGTASSAGTASGTETSSGGNEINGFKFILNTIVGLIKGLFQRK